MHHVNIKPQLEHHHKDCFAWALYCSGNDRELANDILQASYLKMLERQHTFKGQSTFKTWAFRIIKNSAIDAFRKNKREMMVVQNANTLIEVFDDSSQENEFDKKLKTQFFSKALQELSGRQQQIIQLVFYHDMSLNQSAEVLKISKGSVRKHYGRAKKILAKWFQKNGLTNIND